MLYDPWERPGHQGLVLQLVRRPFLVLILVFVFLGAVGACSVYSHRVAELQSCQEHGDKAEQGGVEVQVPRRTRFVPIRRGSSCSNSPHKLSPC